MYASFHMGKLLNKVTCTVHTTCNLTMPMYTYRSTPSEDKLGCHHCSKVMYYRPCSFFLRLILIIASPAPKESQGVETLLTMDTQGIPRI